MQRILGGIARFSPKQTGAFAAKTDTNLWPPCGHGRVVAGCPVDRHYARIGHGVLAADRLRWAGGVWLRSSMDEPMSKERASHSTRLLTTREAAAELGVHERTLRRYVLGSACLPAAPRWPLPNTRGVDPQPMR